MSSHDDDRPGPGDRTEVVPYDEATKRRPSSAPTTLGRYKLDKIIAQGGMAEIWLASVEGPGRFSKKVVLKRIRPSLVKMASKQGPNGVNAQVEMFVREARLLASLEHRNIVQVIELGVEPARARAPLGSDALPEHYIVMEYLEGLTLRDLALRVWQAKRPLPLEVVVRAVADACLGLDHAHRLLDERGQPANLVHRDISPDNLFLTNAGVTKLLDFGIAKREDWSGLTVAGELKGKVPYMAPEQLKGDRVDARTDLFSVGVVLYWLLTGRRPFDGPSEVFTMKAILDDAARPLRQLNPQVPPLLEEVVLSCLEKDPAHRISSASALHDTLSMLLLGLPGAAPDVPDVVKAALSLPPAPYELVPDVAAVPVQRWTGAAGPSSSLITASRAAAPIPDASDVSQARTQQMALEGKVARVDVGASRGGPKTVLGDGDDAQTLYEVSPADIPSTLPPQQAPPSGQDFARRSAAVLPTDPIGRPVALVSADGDTVQRPLPALPPVLPEPPPVLPVSAPPVVNVDAPTQQRQVKRSWKDQVPAELRDTVDLGLNDAQQQLRGDAAGASSQPVPRLQPVPSNTSSSSMDRPTRRPAASGGGGIVAVAAGVVAALGVLVVIAVAVGALPNPLASSAVAVVDAGSRAVVVDAGAAPVLLIAVDAGALAVIAPAVDAGLVGSVVDAGAPVPVDAGAPLVDAGVAVVDDELPVGDGDATPKKKKKRAHVRAPVGSAGEGVLVVRVRPWAKISIDGLAIGTTPLPSIPLPVGRHKLRLEHDALVKALVVDIKPNETTTLQVDMRDP